VAPSAKVCPDRMSREGNGPVPRPRAIGPFQARWRDAILRCVFLVGFAHADFFIDLVGEQGFGTVGTDSGSLNPRKFGVYEPETATSDQLRLCHVLSSSYPADEKQNVHNTLCRGVNATGDRLPFPNALLAAPVGFTLVWDTAQSNISKPFAVWDPVCPAQFVALGQVGVSGLQSPPSLTEVVCVAEDCTGPCGPGLELWNSRDGSGTPKEASVWTVYDHDPELYVAGCNRLVAFADRPPAPNAFHCLKKSCLRFSPYSAMVGVARTATYPPQGVHLALGYEVDSMSVAWQTLENTAKPLSVVPRTGHSLFFMVHRGW
jgi:hypothetical protein